VHAGRVERILAAGNAHKAGALLERLWPQTRHLLQRLARPKRAIGVAVQDDILRQARPDSG
jgi:hypothetical protein